MNPLLLFLELWEDHCDELRTAQNVVLGHNWCRKVYFDAWVGENFLHSLQHFLRSLTMGLFAHELCEILKGEG